jgi:hypothetical protein
VLRALAIVLVYLAMLLAWTAAGLCLILAPRRSGNLVNESFGLFPAVGVHDWGKKLVLRLIGLGLLAFAARFISGIRQLVLPGN